MFWRGLAILLVILIIWSSWYQINLHAAAMYIGSKAGLVKSPPTVNGLGVDAGIAAENEFCVWQMDYSQRAADYHKSCLKNAQAAYNLAHDVKVAADVVPVVVAAPVDVKVNAAVAEKFWEKSMHGK